MAQRRRQQDARGIHVCGLTMKMSSVWLWHRNIKLIKHKKMRSDASGPRCRRRVDAHLSRHIKGPARNVPTSTMLIHLLLHINQQREFFFFFKYRRVQTQVRQCGSTFLSAEFQSYGFIPFLFRLSRADLLFLGSRLIYSLAVICLPSCLVVISGREHSTSPRRCTVIWSNSPGWCHVDLMSVELNWALQQCNASCLSVIIGVKRSMLEVAFR